MPNEPWVWVALGVLTCSQVLTTGWIALRGQLDTPTRLARDAKAAREASEESADRADRAVAKQETLVRQFDAIAEQIEDQLSVVERKRKRVAAAEARAKQAEETDEPQSREDLIRAGRRRIGLA